MNELALFAGAGGGILGGHLLGWKTVCAVERDAYAAGVLAQRQNDGLLPPFPIWSDVQTFDGKLWRGCVDVVSGGFPCQDISFAGKGKGITGERSGLWKEFARIIGEVRPPYAFIENSPALIIRGLDVVLSDLALCGYDAEWLCLSGKACGAVHLRDRIWILAADNRSQRDERFGKEPLLRIDPFPWGKDVRRLAELRKRSDIPQPLIRRINHDVAFGMDRLKAIGNGQIPRVAATAFHTLMRRIDHENH
ncbi:MAG: DNA cytosine methyltransferase [Pseudomonadales bacterium]|nr:DNA cytosine methyltransferase [Pseudomonadales bacterium]